jgi:hypothetical protein
MGESSMITIYIYSLGYKSYKASFLPLIQEGASHIHPSSQRTIVSVLKAHTENTVPFQLSASSSHRPGGSNKNHHFEHTKLFC